MEPVRPLVDEFVLDWITREPLSRNWFFEQRDATCRLLGSFVVRLSETALSWRQAVAPFTEWVARALWPQRGRLLPPTRLTQSRRRDARGATLGPSIRPPPRPPKVCRLCGAAILGRRSYCSGCTVAVSKEHIILALTAAQSAEARARRSGTLRRHGTARRSWVSSDRPAWLDKETYLTKVQPMLMEITNSSIVSALGISRSYAAEISAGRCPHPRHWQALAQLAGVSAEENRSPARSS